MANNRLYIQQISTPIVAKNNVRILPGCTGIVSAALETGKSTFIPRNTIMGKGVAYVRPLTRPYPYDQLKLNLKTTNAV